jgi:arylamine N-acetyltransferase
VDIGFGGPASPKALPLRVNEELPGGWRITGSVGEELEMATRSASGWQTLYRFTLEPQHWADYGMRNWYTATDPQSVFRHSLRVALSEEGARRSLCTGQFTRRGADGEVEQRSNDQPVEIFQRRRAFRWQAEARQGRVKLGSAEGGERGHANLLSRSFNGCGRRLARESPAGRSSRR